MNGDGKVKSQNTPKVAISVRNFGPITEADLDLRPLTVFVGSSNTGKTYLSVLIYALHRMFEGFSEFLPLYNLEQLAANWYYKRPVDTTQKIIDKLNIGKPLAFSDLPQEVRELALKNLRLGPISENIEDELKRCFDLDSAAVYSRKWSVWLIRLDRNQPHSMTNHLTTKAPDETA